VEKLSFDGKVVVITGAGRGLGRSHALAFAERGALVVVNDIGAGVDGAPLPDSPALELVQMITDAGGTAIADFNDVSSAESAAKIVAHAVDEFGRIDVVVNNAGIHFPR
jgi:NAD(P)-dependent dehydrogenase (short-subunit alcohol dehydrogenase family)